MELRKYKRIPLDRYSAISDLAKIQYSQSDIKSYSIPSVINVGGIDSEKSKYFLKIKGKVISPPAIKLWNIYKPIVLDQGIILTEDGYVIEESLVDYKEGQLNDHFLLEDRYLTLKSEVADGSVKGHLLKKRGQTNYGHWLFELLVKHYFILKVTNNKIPALVHSAQYDFLNNMYYDSLSLLGVTKNIVSKFGYSPLKLESISYVTGVTQHPILKNPLMINMRSYILEHLNIKDSSLINKEGLKIFITRSKSHNRNISNVSEVEDYFKGLGYIVIEPQSLSFIDQVKLFSKATHIVGIMGAAMCNSLWASKECKVIYLASEAMDGRFYIDQEGVLERSTFNIFFCSRLHFREALFDDIYVDLDKLKIYLKKNNLED